MRWQSSDNKYNAHKVEYDGYLFDSRAEVDRYVELKLLEKAGEISDLQVHPRFELLPEVRRNNRILPAIRYTADFSYLQNGEQVVEDVKGYITRDASLRMNLFQRLNPKIKFQVIRKG